MHFEEAVFFFIFIRKEIKNCDELLLSDRAQWTQTPNLNTRSTYSLSFYNLSNKHKTMCVLQMVQQQPWIYSGLDWDRHLRSFYIHFQE